MNTVTLNLAPISTLADEQFYDLCLANPDVKFERNSRGEVIILAPTGGETGIYNAGLIAQFWIWNNRFKLGKVFDSSTCFKLPNNANRSPDVSWISIERWNALTDSQKEKFPPITPDFVLELMSPTDTRKETQSKMQEYIENGARLVWLLDRRANIVEIYRQNQVVEVLNNPDLLSGENVLPEFSLDLRSL
jgi:Uma2 family endonuclease